MAMCGILPFQMAFLKFRQELLQKTAAPEQGDPPGRFRGHHDLQKFVSHPFCGHRPQAWRELRKGRVRLIFNVKSKLDRNSNGPHEAGGVFTKSRRRIVYGSDAGHAQIPQACVGINDPGPLRIPGHGVDGEIAPP
jgi:hypothetical protein